MLANAFAPLNWTPTEVRYFVSIQDVDKWSLFTRVQVTNHTKAGRDYNSQSIINTATVPSTILSTKHKQEHFNMETK